MLAFICPLLADPCSILLNLNKLKKALWTFSLYSVRLFSSSTSALYKLCTYKGKKICLWITLLLHTTFTWLSYYSRHFWLFISFILLWLRVFTSSFFLFFICLCCERGLLDCPHCPFMLFVLSRITFVTMGTGLPLCWKALLFF